ncbi:MAG: cysteine hydrolase [Candidatus Andersenbacteria bacterium CG10_big_fil_rev_8_21_14_0_10_54_11]|uniref:Cysteine hydrolase n=1 Tax=Candidatus Andersenbacteria bacterium CG10_big_fil_rev_8_21_14_0_10_54_11 TaxID=1974485 RepID=A0A2M6WZ58_9BACT|nr:MAG: cysteine hydrolase [Candidatus Andersenbacteria bacterium CG10_big_fil_rev_8_21_14_0_10_54_11]
MNKSALILIDFINEIVDEKGKFAGKGYPVFVKAHGVLENVNAAIAKARAKDIPVIFVRVGFSPDYREWPESSPLFGAAKKFGALQLGAWATEIHESLNRTDADFLITKHRVSAFYATSLEAILRTLKVDTLLLGGVATDIAVQSAAREAHDRDYRVVVLEDLCGAGSEDDHAQVLRLLAKVTTVAKSTEVPELN